MSATLNLLYGDSTVLSQDESVPYGATLNSYTIPTVGFTTNEKIKIIDNATIENTDATVTTPHFKVEKSISLPLAPNPTANGGSILASLLSSLPISLSPSTSILLDEVSFECEGFTSPADTQWWFVAGLSTNTFNHPINVPSLGQVTYLLIRVLVNLPAGPITSEIVIKAGTIAPADNVVLDCSNKFISFSTRTDLTQFDGTNYIFINDYSLKGTRLVAPLTTYNVSFPPNSTVPNGTFLSLAIVNPSVSAGNPFVLNPSGGEETDLLILIDFPVGTKFCSSVTFNLGSVIGGGNSLALGSIFTAATIGNLVLGRSVFEPGFTFPDTSVIESVNPTAHSIHVDGCSTVARSGNIPHGLFLKDGLTVGPGTIFPAGYELESTLHFKEHVTLTSSITLSENSLIGAGSVLQSGSATLKGIRFRTPINLPLGTLLESALKYASDVKVAAATVASSLTNIVAGWKFSSLSLSTGTQLPSGLWLFGKLKVDSFSGTFLASGFTFIKDTIFSPGFVIPGNSSFKPSHRFPPFSTFNGVTNFPSGTHFSRSSLVPAPFPVPGCFTFKSGAVLPVNFTFKAGAQIPRSVDYASNIGFPNNLNIITINGNNYYVIQSGSILTAGKTLSEGTFLSQQSGGTTTASNFGTSTGAPALTFPAGTWTAIDGSVGGSPYVLSPQTTPSINTSLTVNPPIILTADFVLTSDLIFPVSSTEHIFDHLSLSFDLVTLVATTLTQDYHIIAPGTAEWPADVSLPCDWDLSEPLTVSSSFTSTASIQLPYSSALWISGIIDPAGSLQFPPNTTTLCSPIQISTTIGVGLAGSGTGSPTVPAYIGSGANTYAILPVGTTLLLALTSTAVPTYVTLTSSTGPIISCYPFTLNTTISVYSAFTITACSLAPAGSYTLAALNIAPGQSLPEGVTLPQNSIVAHDFRLTLADAGTSLPAGTVLSSCSSLSAGTVFPTGLTLTVCAKLDPIHGTTQIFFVPINTNLGYPFYYYQFVLDSLFYVDHHEHKEKLEALCCTVRNMKC